MNDLPELCGNVILTLFALDFTVLMVWIFAPRFREYVSRTRGNP